MGLKYDRFEYKSKKLFLVGIDLILVHFELKDPFRCQKII